MLGNGAFFIVDFATHISMKCFTNFLVGIYFVSCTYFSATNHPKEYFVVTITLNYSKSWIYAIVEGTAWEEPAVSYR